MKKTLILISIIAVMMLILSTSLMAQEKELMKFEENESLEQIKAKIKHNGFEFNVGHNKIYDMPAEQKAKFHSRHYSEPKQSYEPSDEIGPLAKVLGTVALPSSFDWRNYNGHSYIGPVRDQGSCGSCYSFGAAAAAEGSYNVANGLYGTNCVDFSEAFIAFCLSDIYSGFDGCEGANYDYDELKALVEQGVPAESAFPYTDYEQSCKSDSWDAPRTKFASWHRVPCNDIDAIKTAIMTYGVVDAAVYVSSAFEAYTDGIFSDTSTSCSGSPCAYTPTNHAIALVGWNDNGNAATNGYWILRNSWGPTWGESGYMRIKYTSARVACEVCYLVSYTGQAPTPTPTPTNYIIANIPVPLSIPDGIPVNGLTSSINMTANAQIHDVNVDVDIIHSYVGDVSIQLTHTPNSKSAFPTTVSLLDRPGYPGSSYGCGGKDIRITFDDEASEYAENVCGTNVPSIDGVYKSINPLSAFDGQDVNGIWTLKVTDALSSDIGALANWGIKFDTGSQQIMKADKWNLYE